MWLDLISGLPTFLIFAGSICCGVLDWETIKESDVKFNQFAGISVVQQKSWRHTQWHNGDQMNPSTVPVELAGTQ